MKKKDLELLNRLKIVKVASEGASEDYNKSKRPLPQQRRHHGMPDFGYEEPKIIPEGKCTLRQVLEFLSNHQNDPEKYSVEAIAKAYSMKSSDVENIIEYFRVFELYISREEKTSVAKAAVQNLGVGKVVKPLYHSKFKHLEQEKFVTHTQGEKKE